ncbi:MAG TPA: HAD-IIIA family hydrolase, partial [Rhodocyclaceae bacterium]|nr:HAD-IIIA family hydrolase [Rhodocyclaceae bacterium]
SKGRPAVFIDKDGTLIHDVPYNVDVKKIRFRREAGAALRRLQEAGYALILVSNQSGIAHQLFDEADLEPVWEAIRARLAIFGATLDGIFYCPHHPHGPHPRYGFLCQCRKPRPGLLLRAAAQCGLDLSRSWLIGDILDDVEAGRRAGCRTVLLDVGSETEWQSGPERQPHFVATSLAQAADLIVAHTIPSESPAWTA